MLIILESVAIRTGLFCRSTSALGYFSFTQLRASPKKFYEVLYQRYIFTFAGFEVGLVLAGLMLLYHAVSSI